MTEKVVEPRNQTLTEALAPFLTQVEKSDLPIVLVILERAAARYDHAWSKETDDPVEKAGLKYCGDTEDAIADLIESYETDVPGRVDAMHARFPTMLEVYDSVIKARSRKEQFRTTAEAELGGANALRECAATTDGAVSARLAAFAYCEEANSTFLKVLTGDRPDSSA